MNKKITVILGPQGSGKTTLAKNIVAGRRSLTISGEYVINKKSWAAFEWGYISYIIIDDVSSIGQISDLLYNGMYLSLDISSKNIIIISNVLKKSDFADFDINVIELEKISPTNYNESGKIPSLDFQTITNSISSLLEYKNEKYGNSALEPLHIFSGKCASGQRLDDKLARVKNGTELRKNDIADLLGYLVLTCKEMWWTNFDEFKD